jgi:hypothetical protein
MLGGTGIGRPKFPAPTQSLRAPFENRPCAGAFRSRCQRHRKRESQHCMTDCEIMPDDSLHPGPRFRSVIRRPFIEDGAHSFTVESQPESVLLRKLGNLFFSIFLVYRPNAFQVRIERRL